MKQRVILRRRSQLAFEMFYSFELASKWQNRKICPVHVARTQNSTPFCVGAHNWPVTASTAFDLLAYGRIERYVLWHAL